MWRVNRWKFIWSTSFDPPNNRMRKTAQIWLFPPFSDVWIETPREMKCIAKCTWFLWLREALKSTHCGQTLTTPGFFLTQIATISNKRLSNILCLHFFYWVSFYRILCLYTFIVDETTHCLWKEVIQSPSSEYSKPQNASLWKQQSISTTYSIW